MTPLKNDRLIRALLRQDTDPVVLAGVPILGKEGLTISQVISIVIITPALPAYLLLRSGRIGQPIEPLPEQPDSG